VGFGFSLTTASRGDKPPPCLSVGSIGIGKRPDLASTLAGSSAPAATATPATKYQTYFPAERESRLKATPLKRKTDAALPIPQHEFLFAGDTFNLAL